MKKIILATLISGAMSASVFAADMGHGKVNFKGAIIDAPCSISPNSIDQTVDLGQVSNALLVGGGKSSPRTFDIALENCDVSELEKGVKLTFTGRSADFDTTNKTLDIMGSASGAGIQITNGSGNVIALGTATSLQAIQNGNNTLRFSAYLMGNPTKTGEGENAQNATVTSGEFTAVTDFTLSYQ